MSKSFIFEAIGKDLDNVDEYDERMILVIGDKVRVNITSHFMFYTEDSLEEINFQLCYYDLDYINDVRNRLEANPSLRIIIISALSSTGHSIFDRCEKINLPLKIILQDDYGDYIIDKFICIHDTTREYEKLLKTVKRLKRLDKKQLGS